MTAVENQCSAGQYEILKHVEDMIGKLRVEFVKRQDRSYEEFTRRHDETADRISALTQSITAYMDKSARCHEPPCEDLLNSMPKRDMIGHARWHETDILWAERMKDLKWYILKVALGAGGTAFFAWLGLLMWNGFLIGPKP